MELTDLQQWVNMTQKETDYVALSPVRALAATLDYASEPETGAALPPLWHWLFFLTKARRGEIGSDGHPKRGGFLPPVTLPRRMWAGSRLQWHGQLRIGDCVERTSTIESVECKTGRGGALVFVKVRHEIRNEAGARLAEWQDIVYRDAPPATAQPASTSTPAPTDETWSEHWQADPVLLFRFSALTFNAHRIHYDRPYAQDDEHYPGLVVHGPLLALLMMELGRSRRPERAVGGFQFRGMSPVFDMQPFDVCGGPDPANGGLRLYVRDHAGTMAAHGRLTYAE